MLSWSVCQIGTMHQSQHAAPVWQGTACSTCHTPASYAACSMLGGTALHAAFSTGGQCMVRATCSMGWTQHQGCCMQHRGCGVQAACGACTRVALNAGSRASPNCAPGYPHVPEPAHRAGLAGCCVQHALCASPCAVCRASPGVGSAHVLAQVPHVAHTPYPFPWAMCCACGTRSSPRTRPTLPVECEVSLRPTC